MGSLLAKLRQRDPHNQTLAVLLLLVLARVSKTYKGMQAYTMWNCTATLLQYALRPRGWEQPLFCNSMAIFASFRCASADAHSDFVKRSGYSNFGHVLGDQVIHLLPVIVTGISLKRHKRFLRPQHGALSLLAQLFFAYSQAGKMDMGDIYVPHDVTAAWTSGFLGQLLAPTVINNAIVGRWWRSLSTFLLIMSPYLSKKFGLRKLINKRTLAREAIERGNGPIEGLTPDTLREGTTKGYVCERCGRADRTALMKASKSHHHLSGMSAF